MKYWVLGILLSMSLAGCERHSELHDAMEEMKGAYKTMRETDDLAEVEAELADFLQALQTAKAQAVKEADQLTFDKGMRELEETFQQLREAVSNGSLDEVKTLLQKMGDARKEYHEKLDVK